MKNWGNPNSKVKKRAMKLYIEESNQSFPFPQNWYVSNTRQMREVLFCLRLQSHVAFFHMLIKFHFVSLHS